MIILIIIGILCVLLIGSWIQDTFLIAILLANIILWIGVPYWLLGEYGLFISFGALLYGLCTSD